ncbi:MAG TPA: hypothetical protein VFB81_21020, partial [Myxococcales bacterium]|nr:hypothetical protein [Myxococcales bacterium]
RWFLFFTMMVYGFSKVVPLQMRWDEARLVEPLGSMSPMGLLWTFMGVSSPYQQLAGLGEVIGGLLLVWRRTAGVGALLLLAVLGNVVALNFCYDVPVKIFSAELWLMAAFIAAPDALRIFRLLVLRRPTEPAPDVALVRSERLKRFTRLRWLGPAAAIAWAGWGVYDHLPFEWAKRLAEMEAKAPVSGVYQVQSFTAPADARPGSAPAGAAWARVGGGLRRLSVLRADGSFGHIRFEQAPDGAVKLTPLDSTESTLVRVEHPDPEHVRIAAEGFEVKMKKIPRESFLLLRGFHWVQPKPLNR